MILFNEQIIHIFELSKDVFGDLAHEKKNLEESPSVSEDTKTRLFYFYFGFTFLGIGSLLYQVFCPNLIKEHGSDREFIREEVGLMTEKRFRLVSAFLDQEELASSIDLDDVIERYKKANNINIELRGKEKEAAATDLMLMQWQYENWSSPLVRGPIFFLYILGFLVLAIPSLEMFYKVLRAFLS